MASKNLSFSSCGGPGGPLLKGNWSPDLVGNPNAQTLSIAKTEPMLFVSTVWSSSPPSEDQKDFVSLDLWMTSLFSCGFFIPSRPAGFHVVTRPSLQRPLYRTGFLPPRLRRLAASRGYSSPKSDRTAAASLIYLKRFWKKNGPCLLSLQTQGLYIQQIDLQYWIWLIYWLLVHRKSLQIACYATMTATMCTSYQLGSIIPHISLVSVAAHFKPMMVQLGRWSQICFRLRLKEIHLQ